MNTNAFDVIVVGAGHAGVEACLASARSGLRTLMVTTNLERIAYMSCNPSIGGLAKGHMVREIDVLGGEMGFIADETCIQYKRLNSSKGPAVRGTRVQSDKELYASRMAEVLRSQANLELLQGEVHSLMLAKDICEGVVLKDGSRVHAKSVILTTGTFMNGVMHMGLEQTPGGRVGDEATIGLSDQLAAFGFEVRRLKTGTPARLHRDSIDWSQTVPQYGDQKVFPFSLRTMGPLKLPQVACYLSRTTEETHEIIRKNLHLSPMYCGVIEGVGPRYCPSIEDKVVRFGDRDSHQTFLEPESLSTDLIYLQGISTSLPRDVQDAFLRTIPGLEHVKVARYGYAVEYDFFEPTQIWHRLETRPIRHLFMAGQINGTSGYEEAAAQGLIAGLNAVRCVRNQPEFVLSRDEAYIGVLIDDLVTKGTREPYRMFTSRAEHRLVLREDNTVDRLSMKAIEGGIVSSEQSKLVDSLNEGRSALRAQLREQRLLPNPATQDLLRRKGVKELNKPTTFEEFLRRPEMDFSRLAEFGFVGDLEPSVSEALEIEVKYDGYIRRQMELIEQSKKMEDLRIPNDIDFKAIRGLSSEEVQKLEQVKPRTLGQAQRISGVNPSAVQAMMIYLKGHRRRGENSLVGSTDRELAN